MTAIITILSFLVTVGVLVVIHEYGHYWVAKTLGVKILRFSVGFGRVLWVRRRGPDETEWAISAIPLGGYVKMLDEREGVVRESEAHRAFNRKSVTARILIVLAGPVANFLLAFLIYWALFVAGLPGMKPVLGDPPRNTPAAAAGIVNGDIVRSVADEPVFTWTDVRWMLLKEAVKRETVAIEIQSSNGSITARSLDLSAINKDDLDRDFLGKLGLRSVRLPAEFGRILPGGAAERAGFKPGDRVVGISGRPIASWSEFMAEVAQSANKPLVFEIERGGQRLEIKATPERAPDDAKRGRLGVEAGDGVKREFERMTTTVRYGPIEAIGKAAHKVYDLSVFSIKMLGRMIVGDVSWKNLSGPITIADYAGQSAQMGWITYLGFLALVSVSLGVLNLLPIPLLDGGHLVYYLAEIVMRRPVSERVMEIGQRFGLALLLGLTFFAFYNDLNRLFTG